MKIKHLFFFTGLFISFSLHAEEAKEVIPQNALQKLIEGNKRFVKDACTHPDCNVGRRLKTVEKQEPFAVILGCSDSRVSPEIIFDQGIGDLFIVRVAGNVVGPIELQSINYSVDQLHSSIILVLGHESCGAVSAVLQGQTGDIQTIAKLIDPAVEKSKTEPGNKLENAIKENVKMVVDQLQKNQSIHDLVNQKKLLVKGGFYHFQSGEVELLE